MSGTKIDDGGPAFPNPSTCATDGMSLRDYFAGLAMQSVITSDKDDLLTFEKTADLAYRHADAMLEARESATGDAERSER